MQRDGWLLNTADNHFGPLPTSMAAAAKILVTSRSESAYSSLPGHTDLDLDGRQRYGDRRLDPEYCRESVRRAVPSARRQLRVRMRTRRPDAAARFRTVVLAGIPVRAELSLAAETAASDKSGRDAHEMLPRAGSRCSDAGRPG